MTRDLYKWPDLARDSAHPGAGGISGAPLSDSQNLSFSAICITRGAALLLIVPALEFPIFAAGFPKFV